jgi:hypothetical protein
VREVSSVREMRKRSTGNEEAKCGKRRAVSEGGRGGMGRLEG